MNAPQMNITAGANDDVLKRIADALERIAPPAKTAPDFDSAEGFIWQPRPPAFAPVGPDQPRAARDSSRASTAPLTSLLENTTRFAEGLPANNALLWGARGMGKSSLVKAAHAQVRHDLGLKLGRGPT